MKYKLVHIPQVPMKGFEIEVVSPEEAWRIANILWNYDLFQYENKVKPDYCNTTDLLYWDEEEKDWLSWNDDDCNDFREHFENGNIG